AAAAMTLGLGRAFDEPALLAGALLVGVPIFDTALVSISRRRRGISLLQGGRDHSTHRLAARFGSTRRASLVLAVAQVLLCGLAAGAAALGSTEIVVAAGAAVVAGRVGGVVLGSPGVAPDPARQRPGGV